MAKQGGAYYAAAQQARNVKPVDFGAIAKGFAQVQEDRRLEAEKKAKEEEQYQLETLRRYGEDIAAGFDNVGIEDVDSLGVSLKGLIIDKSEELNQMYSDGSIDKRTFELGMMKLKSQSNSYAGFYTSIKDYAESLRADGDFSASDEQMLKRMDLLVKDARPIMDKKGNISFVSVVDGKTTVTPFSQLKNLMQKNDTPDYNGFLDEMVSTEGAQDEYIIDQKTGSLRKSYLTREGDLTDNQKTGISDYVTSLDAFGVANVAGKLGIDVKFSDTDVNSIENEEAVRASVQSELEKLAISKYQRKDVVIEKKKDNILSGRTRSEQRKMLSNAKSVGYAMDLLSGDPDLSKSALNSLKQSAGVKNIYYSEKDGGQWVIQYKPETKKTDKRIDVTYSGDKIDRLATATDITAGLLYNDPQSAGNAGIAADLWVEDNKDYTELLEGSLLQKVGAPEIVSGKTFAYDDGTYGTEELDKYNDYTSDFHAKENVRVINDILNLHGVSQSNNIRVSVKKGNINPLGVLLSSASGKGSTVTGGPFTRPRHIQIDLLNEDGSVIKSKKIPMSATGDQKVEMVDKFAKEVLSGEEINNEGQIRIDDTWSTSGKDTVSVEKEDSKENQEMSNPMPDINEDTEITDEMAQEFADKYPRSFRGKSLDEVKEIMIRTQATGGFAKTK